MQSPMNKANWPTWSETLRRSGRMARIRQRMRKRRNQATRRRNGNDDERHCAISSTARQSPVETTIPGQIAAPLLWHDGRLFTFVVDRDRPGTLRLWTSHDGGATWPKSDCLTVHEHDEQAKLSQGLENIDFAQSWEDMGQWSFGHPTIRPFDSERVLLTYYAGTPGCLSVHAAVVNVNY